MFTIPPHVAAITDRMVLKDVELDDPRVQACIEHYKALFKIAPEATPTAERYNGVFLDDRLLAVIGEKYHDTYLEVSDCYPAPDAGRFGTAAMYAVLGLYKAMMISGAIKAVATSTLYENKAWQRALERVFDGRKPTSVVYYATGSDFT